MNKIMTSTMKRVTLRGLSLVACIVALGMQAFTPSPAVAATTLPVLWTAGGLSAGIDSAGQAGRIAADASGNVAVVSGPSGGRDLAVTSYTATGSFRWRSVVSPSSGTFVGDWVVAAPNGEFVAVGHNIDSHGRTIGSTLVRYASDGTLQWRVNLVALVARLVVDTGGNAYLAFGGQDIQVHKYNASGLLVWAKGATGIFIAQSLALSPDEADVVLTGNVSGAATWMTAAFDAATGTRRWQVTAAEGIAARDVVVDATRVYVTGEGNVSTSFFLTVVAYDRATGTRLWRTDANPPTCCAYGSRIALAPDGSLVVAGQASSGGYFDWWIVAFNTSGAVRWQARRDAAVSGDEIPAAVLVLADGTTVVSGTGGPVIRDILGNSYMQGVTAGYSSNGTLLWEAFSKLPTVWATALPNGNVCATGGYDALITCWDVTGNSAVTLSSLTLNPTTVVGGSISTGTVTLSGPAPSGGAIVSLTSSNTAVARVPASVTVAAGQSTAAFSVTTYAVTTATSVTLTASYSGNKVSATLTVNPPALSAVTLSPSTVKGGSTSNGTVVLNGPAPTGGVLVRLSSNNTALVTVPSSVTVAAGSRSAKFTAQTKPTLTRTVVTISASSGSIVRRANLAVTP